MQRLLLIGVATLLAGGCHYRPTPVPMAGDRSSIARLAGDWTGTYRGTQTDRTGSITFTIRADADSAFGDVLMEAPPGAPVIQAADGPIAHRAHARGPQLLAVKFVGIHEGEVQGALEPYIAPDCDCTVTTRFTGRVVADTIRGTFVTRGALIGPQIGVWTVTRSQ
jgi:hypothetical protein